MAVKLLAAIKKKGQCLKFIQSATTRGTIQVFTRCAYTMCNQEEP